MKTAPTANKKGITPPPPIDGLDKTKAAAVLAVVAPEQPYSFGAGYRNGCLLWILHQLWIEDKHRALIGSPLWRRNVSFKGVAGPLVGELRKVGIDDEGAVFKFFPDDPSMDVEGEGHATIGIAPGLPWEGGSVVTVLSELSGYVSNLIQRMEVAL